MAATASSLREPVECAVRIDGQAIVAFYGALREVSVDASRAAATVATLVFSTVRDERGRWTVQDAGVFQPWKRIVIEACFGAHREEVMSGFVREVAASHPADMGEATVTVVAQDGTLALDREHLRCNWSREDQPLTDGQIVQRIAADHGLSAQAEPGLTHTSLNCDQTAIQFLRDRAQANGFELWLRSGVLNFGPSQLGGAPQATIKVHAGRDTNCISFAARFDGHRPDQVRLQRAADRGTTLQEETVKSQLPLLGRSALDSAAAGLTPFVWMLAQPPGATAEAARALARARADENAWKIVAEGELDGALYEHVLLTHRTVGVDGVGSTHGGLYYVDRVRHVFNPSGYRQNFRLLRNAVGESAAVGADLLASLR